VRRRERIEDEFTSEAARSARQRTGEPGDELDQVGLTARAGLFKQAAEMHLHRRLGDPKRRRDLADAADSDEGEENPQLCRREPVAPGYGLRHRRTVQRSFANEHGRNRRIVDAGAAPFTRRQRQHVGDMALAGARHQLNGDTLDADRGVALSRGGEQRAQGLIGPRIGATNLPSTTQKGPPPASIAWPATLA